MLKLYVRLQNGIYTLQRNQEAQDGFEYLLVSGLVTVAIVAGIVAGAPGALNTLVGAVVTKISAELA